MLLSEKTGVISKKNSWIIILAVGIIIPGVYYTSYKWALDWNALFHILHGVIMSAGLWVGCGMIVTYLWKNNPWEHEPLKHLVIEILAIITYTITFSTLIYVIEKKLNFIQNFRPTLLIDALMTILITLFITSIYEAVFFYRQWEYNFSKSIRLEKDNIEAKYEALKSQVNPHFLFNSLNTLVSLIEDNEQAVRYVQNLSEFMRYMITGSNNQLVLLREELEMLDKYIHILKIRFGENLKVTINFPESYSHFSIPPLVLQILTENCIKHNVVSMDKPLEISISATGNFITVENLLQRKPGYNSPGQGLNNIKERYGFFTTREIKIKETKNIFSVTVPLLEIKA